MAALFSSVVFTALFFCEAAVAIASYNTETTTKPHLPAIFVFGDSTLDVGTNSYLPQSLVKEADFPPYGIDFPHSRPTGRFSNALNGADFLARLIGYSSSPRPFLSFAKPLSSYLRKHSLRGASFASAGSGILDPTNSQLTVVSLNDQISHFQSLQQNLSGVHGLGATKQLMNKALFFISSGGNDIFVYLQSNPKIPPSMLMSLLMNQYAHQIKSLYNLGARKFGILSVPALGCCPAVRVTNGGECSDQANALARAFFSSLESLLLQLSSHLPDMKYSLGNLYVMSINVISNPALFKFTNVDTACCGFGRLNAEQGCNATANLCSNRKNHLFWDSFHPSQAAARLSAITLFSGPLEVVSPINFSQLVQET